MITAPLFFRYVGDVKTIFINRHAALGLPVFLGSIATRSGELPESVTRKQTQIGDYPDGDCSLIRESC